jgi:hypothetical protein
MSRVPNLKQLVDHQSAPYWGDLASFQPTGDEVGDPSATVAIDRPKQGHLHARTL